MDNFEPAVSASCPLAFTGASGALFAKAVTALVAAHCGIFDDYRWPEDEADKIFMNTKANTTFDFVILGAGTAGSILASRLTSYFPSNSVLLVEAGSDPGLDSEIPAFLFLNNHKNINWLYKTYPDDKSCLGFNGNSCTWSKGKAMGGSSSINAMLYIRGHPSDYKTWSEGGNKGWSYKELKPNFDKLENKLDLHDCNNNTMLNPWYDIIKEAWKDQGINYYANDSNEALTGTRITKLLTRDGKRLNTAKIYLSEKANLHVLKMTTVHKIIIDSTTNMANGVEIQHANGKNMIIKVKEEVILSAGSVATPQLLMLSGIGPRMHLAENNIKSLVDLPVGQNLQDHILLPLFLKTKFHTLLTPKELNSFLLQYMMSREGIFSHIGITDFMGFIETEYTNYPSIQFLHTHAIKNDKFMLEPFLKGIGYKHDIIKLIKELNKESDLLGIYPTLLHPKSRGEILLSNSDPESKPVIKANYFEDQHDLDTLIKGVKFIKKLTETDSFKALDIKLAILKIPGCSTFPSDSKDYWECYIRHMATTLYHPVGTAKMGLKTNDSVVNADLLVHGMKNLRVVDASVMPTITGGNTVAPTMVIAEKAADIIKLKYKYKSNDDL